MDRCILVHSIKAQQRFYFQVLHFILVLQLAADTDEMPQVSRGACSFQSTAKQVI